MKGGRAENILQASVFLRIAAVQNAGFHNASYHCFFHGAIGLQGGEDAQIVMRTVHFFNDFVVVALRRDQAGIQYAAV